jgi:hypothetical protein
MMAKRNSTGRRGVVGVVIDEGPADWQIIQRDENDEAVLRLTGRWGSDSPHRGVFVRVVEENTSAPAAAHLDWARARTSNDGTWSITLRHVPAGGPYRIQTQLRNDEHRDHEYARRGDTRHFVGVGDLWVIAGQSNSAGYGRSPIADPPEIGVHLLANSMRWQLAAHPLNDSTDTAHPVNREYANPGHSPWLIFAKLLRRQLNVPIGLLQTSLGGSCLTRWNPEDRGPSPLHENLLSVVRAAGGRARGLLWYQGETDAGSDSLANAYSERFAQALQAWWKQLRLGGLPVMTVQLAVASNPQTQKEHELWSVVCEQQRQAARDIPGVMIVPALDLDVEDGIHVTPAGNLLLGERAARLVLQQVYGRPLEARAPNVHDATANKAGDRIALSFEHVTGRFHYLPAGAKPFRVEDGNGELPVESVNQSGGGEITLELARPIEGSAVVHGAFGRNPQPVPVDQPRNLPMLRFHALPVQQPT